MLNSYTINKTITINAPASTVWDTLTNPDLMKLWIWESETVITTDWSVGNPINIRGDFYGVAFDMKGTILQIVPEHILSMHVLKQLIKEDGWTGKLFRDYVYFIGR